MAIITKTKYVIKKHKHIYLVITEETSELHTIFSMLRNTHVFSSLKKAEKYMEKVYHEYENEMAANNMGLPAHYVLFGNMADEFGRSISMHCYELELNGGLLKGEMTSYCANVDKFAAKRRILIEQAKSKGEL